jgi:hypothetical protein|tara:strand:+ start:18 stop:698 length:681 start_codon:yes stop_codon:yes gene_type:complete
MSKISLKHTGGNVVSLNSPTNAPSSADVAFKLPNADGSDGQFMKTDGSGNLSFAAAGGGKVLQVVSTTKTDVFSATITAGDNQTGDITGLTVSITPSNASNKILLMPSVSCSLSIGYPQLLFYKDGSVLTGAIADAANKSYDGSALRRMTFSAENSLYSSIVQTGNFLDTAGGTSAITYSIRITNARSGADSTAYINRGGDTDEYASSFPLMARFISTFTAMEIAA